MSVMDELQSHARKQHVHIAPAEKINPYYPHEVDNLYGIPSAAGQSDPMKQEATPPIGGNTSNIKPPYGCTALFDAS